MEQLQKWLIIGALLFITYHINGVAYEIKQISNDHLRAMYREGFRDGRNGDKL